MVNQIKRGIIEVIKELMALVEIVKEQELGGKRLMNQKQMKNPLVYALIWI